MRGGDAGGRSGRGGGDSAGLEKVARRRRVVLLGSSGSIGRQALEVVAAVPGLEVVGLAADLSGETVVRQAAAAGVSVVALRDEAGARQARELAAEVGRGAPDARHGGFTAVRGDAGAGHAGGARRRATGIEVLAGEAGIAELIARAVADARRDDAELTVLNGIVGAAGLRATLAVLESGATLALANKESLVAGGELVLRAARRSGATVLPVDSEHSALFQCLLAGRPAGGAEAEDAGCGAGGAEPEHRERAGGGRAGGAHPSDALCLGGRLRPAEHIVLTGSGGPFRGRTRADLAAVTPEQALRHPTWSMGQKVTIDSATLMNKGLEVIEAHYLFGVPYNHIEVLISPQSLVHALARFGDGATVAHLGLPDMRTPIGYALTYPDRLPLPMVEQLDLAERSLTFERPDTTTFGCLRLAFEAGKAGGAAPVVLNAANEVAVMEFLAGRLPFLGIESLVESTLAAVGDLPTGSLDEVLAVDREARRIAAEAAGGTRWKR